MDTPMRIGGGRRWLFLLALAALAIPMRAYHFNAPLLDQLHIKQIFMANKARNIAKVPQRAVWKSFDFLDERGERLTRVEEVPLYAGLIGGCYYLFGEQEWYGRVWNILAILVAIVALNDLVRREYDDETGLVASFLFAISPLTIFYGRAFMPDPWMLTCMLGCAVFYRRYLDRGHWSSWLAAAVLGLLAAAFKYYGLMVLIPLADMAYRRGGWRAWFTPRFLGIVSVMVLPIAVWIAAVFARYPNPSGQGAYFVCQAPWLLLYRRFFVRLTLGLFVNDIGPITTLLIALGAWGAAIGKARARPLLGWTVMGLLFVFLLAPKFLDHDYYGMLCVPAAAAWGAVGWRFIRGEISRRREVRPWRVAAVLSLAALIQSPWVMCVKYEMESQHAVVASRLKQLCTPSGKVVVLGQTLGWAVVHYCGRQGWSEEWRRLPTDWQDTFRKHRDQGAELVALTFDPTVPRGVRQTYLPLLETLPILEHQSGPWYRRNQQCEYYILGLGGLDGGAGSGRPASSPASATASNRETIAR